jgi:hypothetical protein
VVLRVALPAVAEVTQVAVLLAAALAVAEGTQVAVLLAAEVVAPVVVEVVDTAKAAQRGWAATRLVGAGLALPNPALAGLRIALTKGA